MATAAGRRDRWLWIFLWWGLVALGVMRDGRREGEEGRSDQLCFSDWKKKKKGSGYILGNYCRVLETQE